MCFSYLSQVSSDEQFLRRLNCDTSIRVKVVSVFGNTGDGKSHTLNHTFFNGVEVFHTSSQQDACTLGVWAAFDPHLKVICLDTEGLLGSTSHENQRTRLLLKVIYEVQCMICCMYNCRMPSLCKALTVTGEVVRVFFFFSVVTLSLDRFIPEHIVRFSTITVFIACFVLVTDY